MMIATTRNAAISERARSSVFDLGFAAAAGGGMAYVGGGRSPPANQPTATDFIDAQVAETGRWQLQPSTDGRGRDEDFSSPPHRSRRALLTHRAPPSGQTSCDERLSPARRPTRSHHSDRRGISAQCPNRGRLTAVPLG
jgi:hypothetical protein